MRRSILSLALSLTLLAGSGIPARATDQAGVSAAVRGDVALNRQQTAVGHQVVGGEAILLQDAIRSGPRSGMQVLLLDQTVFTIGPESEIVIDEFVYDPKTNAGKLSAEVTKGVFRFVTGKIAHEDPADMNVKLPAGTIGVRGTMVAGRVDETKKSSQLVLLGEGADNDTGAPASAFVACNAGECVRVSRPGYGTNIDGPDSPPTQPYLVPPVDIDRLTRDVSDPGGWTETAGSGKSTDVAAGAGGAEDDDTRSAADASGAATASGTKSATAADRRLDAIDVLDQATTDAAQFSSQTILVGGREVTLPRDCVDVASCLGAVGPELGSGGDATDLSGLPLGIPVGLLSGSITSFQDVAVLGTTEQTAFYFRDGIELSDGGSYSFGMNVDFGKQQADVQISALRSPSLGLDPAHNNGVSGFSGRSDLSFPSWPIPFAGITSTITDAKSIACQTGCTAFAVGLMVNGGPNRLAESAAHFVEIGPDSTSTSVVAPVTTQLTSENITVPRYNP